MTTAADLIAFLLTLDPDTLIVQAKNPAGDAVTPTCDYSPGFYRPDVERGGQASTYSGEFHVVPTAEEVASGQYDAYEPEPGDKAAVCLWPTY